MKRSSITFGILIGVIGIGVLFSELNSQKLEHNNETIKGKITKYYPVLNPTVNYVIEYEFSQMVQGCSPLL